VSARPHERYYIWACAGDFSPVRRFGIQRLQIVPFVYWYIVGKYGFFACRGLFGNLVNPYHPPDTFKIVTWMEN
jgi:hypothetical protein